MSTRPSEESMKAAIKYVQNFAYYRYWGSKVRRVEDPRFTHCFFIGHSLYIVFENPKSFPPPLTHIEREALIEFARRDGHYAFIGLVHVEHNLPDEPKVIRTKHLQDYNSCYYPRLRP